MDQVLQTTRDKTGKFTRIEFFKGFYEADFDEQGRHLKGLLEIHENTRSLKAYDSKPSNEPTD